MVVALILLSVVMDAKIVLTNLEQMKKAVHAVLLSGSVTLVSVWIEESCVMVKSIAQMIILMKEIVLHQDVLQIDFGAVMALAFLQAKNAMVTGNVEMVLMKETAHAHLINLCATIASALT